MNFEANVSFIIKRLKTTISHKVGTSPQRRRDEEGEKKIASSVMYECETVVSRSAKN